MSHLSASSLRSRFLWPQFFIDSRFDALTLVRQAIKTALWPLEQIAYVYGQMSSELIDWAHSQNLITERLQVITLENERLRTEQLKLQTLRAENAELRQLLGVKERVNERLYYRPKSALSNDPFVHQVTINRGLLAGVTGRTTRDFCRRFSRTGCCGLSACSRCPLDDRRDPHHLPVQVTRTRERAIAVGVGRMDRIEFRNLPDTVDIVSW